ncbi:septum formation initiator family protein [Chitinophagaceae bacterium LB-8]|uniref:Septum formation initiator family protein n=1 Tax=Paraflavisolibacter caeni TaxID=2982496 RepID=A0A9X2XPM6_9BACT|nr:septum formation initiator family protein [Paraflavisolibacter caeni]MCU7551713.1 septum formation initiator family protein [Paraflavisolibacter caeni]
MKIISYILPVVRNKYLLAVIAFAVWMLFFDKNDVFTQRQRRRELKALEESKAFYTEEIAKEKKVSEELRSNPAAIEKYAREKYFMKRDNEDIFIVEDGNIQATQ